MIFKDFDTRHACLSRDAMSDIGNSKKKKTAASKVAVESAVLCMEMTAGDLTSLLPVGAVDGICKA